MMIIELPQCKIGITFRHRRFKFPKHDEETCDRFMNGITDCEVYRLTETPVMDANLIAVGIGICKWPDAFCKSLGRKASLTSALRKRWGPREKTQDGKPTGEFPHGFSRDDRIAIWEAYWRYTAPQEPPAAHPQDATVTDPVEAANILDPFPIEGEIIGPITGP